MPSRPGAEAGPHGPVRVTLVLDVAAVGGAEIVLRNTFAHLDPRRVVTDVVCLREAGPLADDFRAVTDGVTTLPRGGRFDRAGLGRVPRLVAHFRRRRTDVVVVSHHHRAALTLARIAAVLAGARLGRRRPRHGPHPRRVPRPAALRRRDAVPELGAGAARPQPGPLPARRGGRGRLLAQPGARVRRPQRDPGARARAAGAPRRGARRAGRRRRRRRGAHGGAAEPAEGARRHVRRDRPRRPSEPPAGRRRRRQAPRGARGARRGRGAWRSR